MRIVFSRKGFDTGSGGVSSPIINGVPISLPIPGTRDEPFRYAQVEHPTAGSLAPIVEDLTRGRLKGGTCAHYDPQLPWEPGVASLGQQGASQTHLTNQGVEAGDVIVFFGLFCKHGAPKTDPDSRPHHRIFGMMTIDRLCEIGDQAEPGQWRDLGLPQPHPHTERAHMLQNNAIWVGHGQMARNANHELRLSDVGHSPTNWKIPSWLTRHGLSYHANPDRWSEGYLKLVARGQEFVSDVGKDPEALSWLDKIQDHLTDCPNM